MHETRWHSLIWAQLMTVNITSPISIHAILNDRSSFYAWPNIIPLCVWITSQMEKASFPILAELLTREQVLSLEPEGRI